MRVDVYGVVSTEIFAMAWLASSFRLQDKSAGEEDFCWWVATGAPPPSNFFLSLRSLVMIANEGKVGEEVEEVETRPTRPAQL